MKLVRIFNDKYPYAMAQVVLNGLSTPQPSWPSSLNTTGTGLSLVQPAMHALSSLALFGAYVVQAVFGRPDVAARTHADILKRDIDSFIATERPYALTRLLCNIGPDGCAVPGVPAGVVVASPSKHDPDCKPTTYLASNANKTTMC